VSIGDVDSFPRETIFPSTVTCVGTSPASLSTKIFILGLFSARLCSIARSAAYSEARVVVYPGLGEIFGIVPLEAAFFSETCYCDE